MEKALYEAAKAIAATCSNHTIADILNGLVSVEAEPSLSDDEAASGGMLFDALSDACPAAVRIAQSIEV